MVVDKAFVKNLAGTYVPIPLYFVKHRLSYGIAWANCCWTFQHRFPRLDLVWAARIHMLFGHRYGARVQASCYQAHQRTVVTMKLETSAGLLAFPKSTNLVQDKDVHTRT